MRRSIPIVLLLVLAPLVSVHGQTDHIPLNGPWLSELGRDIRSAPVHPESDQIIALIKGGSGPSILYLDWFRDHGMPINFVGPGYPRRPLVNGVYASESDAGPVPFGPEMAVEAGPDGHLLSVVTNAAGTPIELWEAQRPWYEPAKDTYHADGTARFDLVTGAQRPEGWTSADVAGLPIAPLLLRPGVWHDRAIRVAVPNSFVKETYVWPARSPQYSADIPHSGIGLAMGDRLRLKRASYDRIRPQLDGQAAAILDVLHIYGMIVCDGSGSDRNLLWPCGTNSAAWNYPDINRLQNRGLINATDFEVIARPLGLTISGPTATTVKKAITITVAHGPEPAELAGILWDCYPRENGVDTWRPFGGGRNGYGITRLTDDQTTATFTYTPEKVGTHVVTVEPGGWQPERNRLVIEVKGGDGADTKPPVEPPVDPPIDPEPDEPDDDTKPEPEPPVEPEPPTEPPTPEPTDDKELIKELKRNTKAVNRLADWLERLGNIGRDQ